MPRNIAGEEVVRPNDEEVESPRRLAAREYLELGDNFGGPNRLFSFSEARSIVDAAPQRDEVRYRFLEWFDKAEESGRHEAWGHSLRQLGRVWYWEEAGIRWPEREGVRSPGE